jgi:hypothetical protein
MTKIREVNWRFRSSPRIAGDSRLRSKPPPQAPDRWWPEILSKWKTFDVLPRFCGFGKLQLESSYDVVNFFSIPGQLDENLTPGGTEQPVSLPRSTVDRLRLACYTCDGLIFDEVSTRRAHAVST